MLLPLLELRKDHTTHVVSLSSSASFKSYNTEDDVVKLTLEEINDPVHYDAGKAYGQSKLSNILFVKELQARQLKKGFPKMIVTAVHPGAVGKFISFSIFSGNRMC